MDPDQLASSSLFSKENIFRFSSSRVTMTLIRQQAKKLINQNIKMELIVQKNLCNTATLNKTKKLVFKTDYHLMQVKSITICSKGSILPCFRPSLSYQLSLRPIFCVFLSGCLTQILLYVYKTLQKLTDLDLHCFL